MSVSQMPRALYLQAGTPPVFAIFHPGAGPLRQSAVLLCPPFGWEDMCSYRSRRDWAEHLALEGHPTLRLDLPGSGDSAGDPTDPQQLNSWTQAVTGAAQWLLETTGAARIVGIGIGLGGLVTCRAALSDAPIDELVLWHVPGQGRTLVRELQAFSALEVAYIPDPGQLEPQQGAETLEDGALVANGYLLSAETVAALKQLDLRELSHVSQGPRRALLLRRDGMRVDDALHEALEQAGVQVRIADGPGYAEMILNPQDALPPTKVFQIVSSWINEGELELSTLSTAPSPDPPGETSLSQVSTHKHLELLRPGVELRETPIDIAGPNGQLFGILTEPLGEREEICAVLVNAGPQRRTGPNRMWVEIARRWATRGVPTLRLDLAGIGDSDGDTAALVRVASLYAPAYVGQVRAALDTLSTRGLPSRFVVLGLCSGAYWSTQTALEDERIGTVIMLNPRSLIWDEWVYALRRTRELRKSMLMGSTWQKLLRGEVTPARHLETARALTSRITRSPQRIRERLTGSQRENVDRGEALAQIFDRLSHRGQRVLLVFTGSEPLHRELTAKGLLDHLERLPNLKLAVLGTSADTHTLTPLWLQRQVHELVDRALEEELRRLPEGEERIA
jgi:alpha-beta hydrolase superfamily lysophospholipase